MPSRAHQAPAPAAPAQTQAQLANAAADTAIANHLLAASPLLLQPLKRSQRCSCHRHGRHRNVHQPQADAAPPVCILLFALSSASPARSCLCSSRRGARALGRPVMHLLRKRRRCRFCTAPRRAPPRPSRFRHLRRRPTTPITTHRPPGRATRSRLPCSLLRRTHSIRNHCHPRQARRLGVARLAAAQLHRVRRRLHAGVHALHRRRAHLARVRVPVPHLVAGAERALAPGKARRRRATTLWRHARGASALSPLRRRAAPAQQRN